MNWITTNIRLPEDLYMELKIKAAKERKSVAAIIREKLSPTVVTRKKRADYLLKKLDRLAKRMEKENKGINMTQALIDMRYEQ